MGDDIFQGKPAAPVCPAADAKKRRQRRYRLRQQSSALGGKAVLHTRCRECGAPIKPSYLRGFCANGGTCRKAFFKRTHVLRVIALAPLDAHLSEVVLSGRPA